ncbi:polysaccharide pyruvyl transferase family protein [Stutzerimonas sp.]|uniref:polysaccharide pyruvyl transferase family protein n=1 Tax=Stutzerimonas sp. TaxID=2901166 RepID=UPI0035B0CA6A
MKNKIILHGSHYKDNFGDTLLLKAIQDSFPSFEVLSTTGSYKVLSSIAIDKSGLIDALFSKYFVYGGGGYFGEPDKSVLRWSVRFIYRHALIGVLRRILGCKYIFIGTGFGPLSNFFAKKIARFIINGSELTCLRDKESVSFAKEISPRANIKQTADIVPWYIESNFKKQTNNKLILHLHVPVGDYKSVTGIVEAYINFRNMCYPKHQLVVISDSENDIQQTWFFSFLRDQYPELEIVEYENVDHLLSLISSADYVVTNKLHVGIVAVSLRIKVASIYMHSKTRRFYEQINRVEFCKSKDNLGSFNILDFFIYVNGTEYDFSAIDNLVYDSYKNYIYLKEWLAK